MSDALPPSPLREHLALALTPELGPKRTQAQLIWLLPVVGAAIVFSVISIEEANERPKKEQRG